MPPELDPLLLGPIGGLAATILAVVSGLATFLHYGRNARDLSNQKAEYEALSARLPEAVRATALKKQVRMLQEQHDALAIALASAQTSIAAKDNAEQWLDDNRQAIASLTAERSTQDELRAEIKRLQESQSSAHERLEFVSRKADTTQIRLTGLEAREQGTVSRLNTARDELKPLEETLRNRREELAELESMRLHVDQLKSDLATRTEALNETTEKFKIVSRELAHGEAKRMRLQAVVKQLEVEISANHARRDDSQSQLDEARRELLSLDAERKEYERLQIDLEATQNALARQEEDLKATTLEADGLEFRRDRLRIDLGQVKQDLDALEKKLEDKQKSVADAEHESRRADLKRQSALMEAAKAQESEKKLKGQLASTKSEYQSARKQVDDAVIEQQKLKVSVESLIAERRSLEDSMATLRATREETLEQLRQTGQAGEGDQEIWIPVLTREDDLEETVSDELEALEAAKNHIESQGLFFSERTINAFHTSLKIAEMSPLVVLAGISGTGKSELPRRYAEAMGMHFLPMPVQPRWDSPQDLFGFYNYLEGRFRPTELTRALVQMDNYYDVEGRGWNMPDSWEHSLNDQVLLVLLDEMNLARVEYYFSEFLSKLETRRGIDIDDTIAREKAEISLEVGRQNRDAAIMRIFVRTNVLFVGTMNEDESTQTLSDKVVDRANVLRFGRPSRLRSRDVTDQDGEQEGKRSVLPFQTWLDWSQYSTSLADRDVSDLVDGWIGRLNDAMAKIGRPFAHRAHQSMRSYLANYPLQDDEGLKWAMADQIEQRILPKFRGLDPMDQSVRSSLEIVMKLISELEDDPLKASIDAARNAQHSHQFNWQGVDRAAEAHQQA
jgi:hypothetical protein